MTCSCISTIDGHLRSRNTRLQTAIVFGRDAKNAGSLTLVPYIGTEQIEKGRGKAKAVGVSPTYCPFCGDAYDLSLIIGAAAPEGSPS